MGLLGELKGPILGVVLSTLAFAIVALVGVFDVLGALVSPDATLVGLLSTAIPYVLALVVAGVAGLAAVAWGLYRIATGAVDTDSRLVRNETVASVARLLERQNEWARRLHLAEKVTPTDRERAERDVERLKDDYAAGRISEPEFERELERRIEQGRLDETQASRERDRGSYEYDRS
ncbi:hypothetical protein ACFR9U_08335 [Halorientalis brevis]|uniref:SHOCT domain-containing protein n=1 Tax=Halorientalis brevis TaxID=1126241 RepID=A0ABD6CAG3_9EURY|nr:hypothetical protein [Halorientalis brevis]